MKKYLITNWKMYNSIQKSRELAAEYRELFSDFKNKDQLDLIICPSSIAMIDVWTQIKQSSILMAGQDFFAHQANFGAYTGQISLAQLSEMNCTHALIGHSEMRRYNHVTDDIVSKKIQMALHHNIIPIICIGETEKAKQAGLTDQVLYKQLHHIFDSLPHISKSIIIAYEPIWAIGTGRSCDMIEAQRIHHMIRQIMREFVSNADELPILYGGSVNAQNAKELMNQPDINGLLIGSASTNKTEFKTIFNLFTN